jgi:pilus assembly protein Flp/PilA
MAVALSRVRRAVRQQRVIAFRTHRFLRVGRTRGRKDMDLKARMRAFVSDDSGQDLLEYALLVGLIALVAVLAVTSTGTSVNNIFQAISNSLSTIA